MGLLQQTFQFSVLSKMAFILAVLLHIEVWPVGRTVNQENTITYWVVEFSGLDCDGNIHRVREEVNTYGDATELGVASIAQEQLLKRPELESFLEAICESLPSLESSFSPRRLMLQP